MLDVLDLDGPKIIEETSRDKDELPLELQHIELSECAYFGTNGKQLIQTMKIEGFVKNQPVRIMLNSGSTHNFKDSRLLKRQGWSVNNIKVFEVMVANEGKLKGQGNCKAIPLKIGGYECTVDLFPLPLGGCDLVLGVQWLSIVSSVLWNFQLMTIEFSKGRKTHKLVHNSVKLPLVQEMSF